jgi:hypothetical protein
MYIGRNQGALAIAQNLIKQLTLMNYDRLMRVHRTSRAGLHFHAEYLFILRKLFSVEVKNRIIPKDSCLPQKIYFSKNNFPQILASIFRIIFRRPCPTGTVHKVLEQ